MLRSTVLVIAGSPVMLSAQGGPPAFTPIATPLASIRAEAVPQMLAQWPETRLGRLVADPEVAEAVGAVVDWTVQDLRRRQAIRAAAAKLDLELEPWQLANMYTGTQLWRLFQHPVHELRRAEFAIGVAADADRAPTISAVTLSCLPRYEGRWTAALEREAKVLGQSAWFAAQADSKIAGYPAYLFTPPGSTETNDSFPSYPIARWMLHLPGTFIYGSGMPKATDQIATAEPAPRPQLALTMELAQYVAMFQRQGAIPNDFAMLGFDQLKRLQWRASFAGELLLDEFEVELDGEPKGLFGALLTGKAPLPAQALPKGAIAQLRCAVDLAVLAEVLPALSDGLLDLPAELQKNLLAALDGGVSVGICAPAPGGLIPRMFVSVGISDEPALERALAVLRNDHVPTRQVQYGGVACTVLNLPGLPQGIQPAFCRLAGKLHVAESGRSLRTFLKQQQDGVVAMDVGEAPAPAGDGEVLPTLDLRFDEVELYRAFRETWLPLYALVDSNQIPAPISRNDLPSVEAVAEHCGKSRGILRRNGNRYTVQHLGVLGGPELAALAMAWGPMLCVSMTDYSSEQLGAQLAREKLARVWTGLDAFRQRESRWPQSLAELFASQKLPKDALLLPADDLAETIELANGQTLQTSFRYFPQTVVINNANSAERSMLLVEIRPHSYDRAVLNVVGGTPDVYGPESRKPIAQFGR